MKICEKNSSAVTQVSGQGGGGEAPGARAEVHLQPMVKTMVGEDVPLQPVGINRIAEIHPWRTPTPEQVGT